MDHSDDQEDFAPDDDITLQQELMLLKAMVYDNRSTMTDAEYDRLEKEIKDKHDHRRWESDESLGLGLENDIPLIKTDKQQEMVKAD
jgi:hypothetical protein